MIRHSKHDSSQKLRPSVGARIIYKGNVGTVCYIGCLDGYPDAEEWMGIEWDDASRGRHSGNHNGQRYFTTQVPNAGSFVKASKIGFGGRTTLVQAAQQRLADTRDQSHRKETTIVGRGIVCIADEGSAADQLAKMEVLDVSNMGVAIIRSTKDEPLAEILPQLRDLSVARSLLSEVSAVIEILCEIPKLHTLDASDNRLHVAGNEFTCEDKDSGWVTEKTNRGSSEVSELLLNKCVVQWIAIAMVCEHIEALKILRLHACRLSSFGRLWEKGAFETRWISLQILDLDGNRINWNDVRKLSKLASLRELYISNNGLEDLADVDSEGGEGIFGRPKNVLNEMGGERQAVVPFAKLHTLSIARNELRGWRVITGLNALPELSHLRMMGNPISPPGADAQNAKGPQKGWHLRAIARLSRLTRIDGSHVTMDERLQAERRYVQEEILPLLRTRALDCVKQNHPRAEHLMWKLQILNPKHVTTDLQTIAYVGDQKFLQKGLAADSVYVVLMADERIRTQRTTARRLLPRDTDSERLIAIAKVVLRLRPSRNCRDEDGRWPGTWNNDVTKLSVKVRVGQTTSDFLLLEGRSLASCLNRDENEELFVTIGPTVT